MAINFVTSFHFKARQTDKDGVVCDKVVTHTAKEDNNPAVAWNYPSRADAARALRVFMYAAEIGR